MPSVPRILVALGTRPEAIKMAPVVHALREAGWARVRVLATAQHRELLDGILPFFGIRPDLDLDLMRSGQDLADLTGRMVHGLDRALAGERPDFVLAQGDTTTVFVTALCCFYRGLPFGHVEAGLRTGDPRAPFPEEMNRRLVGRLADLHLAPTEGAAANLRAEGVPADTIAVTGNTVVDALLWTAARVEPAPRLDGGRKLVLVTTHRRESFGAPLDGVLGTIRRIADRPDVEVLFPVHPNPNVHDAAHRILGNHPSVRLVGPLDYPAFVAAMRASHLMLSDSGGVQEEAPSLGVPVLVLREATERPEGIAAGTSILVGTDPDRIRTEAERLLDDPARHREIAERPNPFGDGTAARRIAGLLRARLLA